MAGKYGDFNPMLLLLSRPKGSLVASDELFKLRVRELDKELKKRLKRAGFKE